MLHLFFYSPLPTLILLHPSLFYSFFHFFAFLTGLSFDKSDVLIRPKRGRKEREERKVQKVHEKKRIEVGIGESESAGSKAYPPQSHIGINCVPAVASMREGDPTLPQ